MRSQSYGSDPITYENISNRISRLKVIGNIQPSTRNNPYTLPKSDSIPNINYQYSRMRSNENVNLNYDKVKGNIGRVTKNTGLKKYSQRYVKDAIKHQYEE